MLILTHDELLKVVTKLETVRIIALDTETTGLDPFGGDRIIGISVYLPELDEKYYFSFRHTGENIPLDSMKYLYPVLTDSSKEYYLYNSQFDQIFLQIDGFPILENRVIYRDVMLALHTLDENRFDLADKRGLNYKLKDNARLFLGDQSADAEDELKEYFKVHQIGKGDMGKLPAHIIARYAEDDTELTWRLWQFFKPFIEKWNQQEYLETLWELNSTILPRMRWHGVPVDRDKIQSHIKDNQVESNKALAELKAKYGQDFNPNSPVQVKNLLGLNNARKTTLERANTIESNDILTYKNLTKAEGTFYNPYLRYSAYDGKVHGSFNAGRTSSRRLSSSEPNLQQVPRYSAKYRVKDVFVAPPGYRMVQMDYSQQELRLAAFFSGQENITQVYVENGDVHILTASHLFMVEPEQVTKEQRNIGKTANFGFAYGMGIMKAAVYIASNLKRALAIDQKFYEHHTKYLPKVEYKDEETGETKTRPLTWTEFTKSLSRMYAGVVIVEDAREDEKILPDDVISIWTTTKILFDWKALYPKFVDGLRETSNLASQFRTPSGTVPQGNEQGYKFFRLEDGCVRHYITGQRPFTAWNYKIQGTGGYIMRTALLRIDRTFPITQDEVIPILTVHDSFVFLVKENENMHSNIVRVQSLMEDFPQYYPPMKVDVSIGDNYGEMDDYAA